MAAVLVCLAGSMRASASDAGFTVRTKVAHAPARIDWSVRAAGEWDVTVGFDAARCEVYCAYKLKRDEYGRPRLTGLLLPPVAAIRLYMDSGAPVETIIVDPGGLEQPEISSHAAPPADPVYLPGRRLDQSPPSSTSETPEPAVRSTIAVPLTFTAAMAVPASLPLRI
jgi:hypothetical protein